MHTQEAHLDHNTTEHNPVVIVAGTRTPFGAFLGAFKETSAIMLGSSAIKGALTQIDLPHTPHIDEVLGGCVLSAGLGQAPARQAARHAGLPDATPCTTINKVCGSSMKATMIACQALTTQPDNIMIALGMENMSLAPFLMPNARTGTRYGHHTLLDHMLYDGLQDAYNQKKLMGELAEACAERFGFSRAMQDAFALRSFELYKKALSCNWLKNEITPVTLKNGSTISQDETPKKVDTKKIPHLKPAFKTNGSITAGNASAIADGAAALIITRARHAHQLGIKPLAKIIGYCTHAQSPEWFTTAPATAIDKLINKIHWKIADVNLFEINEAFSVVPMAAIKSLSLDPDKVNIHGGACTIGHPLGASGVRIIVTLLHALHQHKLQRGIASLCIGGGEATAIAIERV